MLLAGATFAMVVAMQAAPGAHGSASDPGVRSGPPGAGSPIAGLTQNQLSFFSAGQTNFVQTDSVTGSVPNTGNGLGPRFNAESCAQCHAQPAIGGTSPFVNPQVADATDQGAANQVPSFITASGPVREARFPYTLNLQQVDGGVHDLFTITGRTDAAGCNIAQDNFTLAAQRNDLIFRIPTPVFGSGLIETISDAAILANMGANLSQKHGLGIAGRPNSSANDGTITRFGWKAQNKSLGVFSGEAYNVEMGVTNELFNTERTRRPAASSMVFLRTTRITICQERRCPATLSGLRYLCGFSINRSRDRVRPRPSMAASCSRKSAAFTAIPRLSPRGNRRRRHSAIFRRTSIPTFCCIIWARTWPTM